MKWNFLSYIFIVSTFFALASCKDKETKEHDAAFLGTWIWQESRHGEGSMDSAPTEIERLGISGDSSVITFYANGTFFNQRYEDGEEAGEDMMHWYTNGGRFYVDDRGEVNSLEYSIAGDSLKLIESDDTSWSIEIYIKQNE